MPSSITKRVFHGFSANIYGQVIVAFIQLAGVPILLYSWGVELYGEWLILFAIPAYLSMTDLGFSLSAANDMTARTAHGDIAGMLRVFQSLAALVFFLMALGLIVVALLITFLPLDEWLQLSQLSDNDVRWVLGLLCSSVLVKLASGINAAGFRACGDYALSVGIRFSTMLIQHGCVWIMAASGKGPVLSAAAFAVVQFVVTPSVAYFLVRRHRSLRFGVRHASFQHLRLLIRPAIANVAMPMAQAVNIQGMVLTVGATLGPAAVVTFSTLRTLTRLAFQMVVSVSSALEPEMAGASGSKDKVLLRRMYVQGLAISFWLSVAAALGLVLLGNWILSIWTDDQVSMNASLFRWLLLSAVASVLWFVGLSMLRAGNRHLRATVWFIFSALSAIAFAATLLGTSGRLEDAGFALLLMDGLMAGYLFRAASVEVKLSIPHIISQMLNLPVLLTALLHRIRSIR